MDKAEAIAEAIFDLCEREGGLLKSSLTDLLRRELATLAPPPSVEAKSMCALDASNLDKRTSAIIVKRLRDNYGEAWVSSDFANV